MYGSLRIYTFGGDNTTVQIDCPILHSIVDNATSGIKLRRATLLQSSISFKQKKASVRSMKGIIRMYSVYILANYRSIVYETYHQHCFFS